MRAGLFLAVAANSILPSAALFALSRSWAFQRATHSSSIFELEKYEWGHFVADFNRTYQEGTHEWGMRQELFQRRLREALQFNAKGGASWKMGISKFMDYTDAERKMLLGYRGSGTRKPGAPAQSEGAKLHSTRLPAFFDVTRPDSVLLGIVRDQGNCGSCWAEAATAVFEGHLENNATLMKELGVLQSLSKQVPSVPTLASQVVVSCTLNERHCGGQGGCTGATVELAYEMVQKEGGLPFAAEWNYVSGMGDTPACKEGIFNHHKVGVSGYTVLPSNKVDPLKSALVETGAPIAVSVDASNWFMYSSGVYTPQGKGEFTVNHAVTLMAYQNPVGNTPGWWKIKNSWGNYWGEEGFIRLEMKVNEEEHCGLDKNTHEGLACDGDPDTAWVCGTCGVLYDSVYPNGLYLNTYKS